MRPWNALSLDRIGTPIIGQIPVRIVAHGAQPTPEQNAMLQATFSGFVAMARQSLVNNPGAQGLLPDGSRYAITCVNGACTCSVWTVEGDETVERSGIGVVIGATRWLLIPPGTYGAPGSKAWKASSPSVLHGGVGTVYRPSDKVYFVESSDGISSGNSRLANPLFSMNRTIYQYPVISHGDVTTSNPFFFGGSVEQLQLTDEALSRRARTIANGVPSATLIETSSALPVSDIGDAWGLLTTNGTGSRILMCRISSDLGSWTFSATNILQSVTLKRSTPGSSVVVTDTAAHPITTSRWSPRSPEGDAPKYSSWERVIVSTTVPYDYTIPSHDPNPAHSPTSTFTAYNITNTHHYSESSAFDGAGVLRRYIDFLGVTQTEPIQYSDIASILYDRDQSTIGFQGDVQVDLKRNNSFSRSASVQRKAVVTLAGLPPISIFSFTVDYLDTFAGDSTVKSTFDRYLYNEFGNITGLYYDYSVMAAGLQQRRMAVNRSERHVLMQDSQFAVAASIEIKLSLSIQAREGIEPRSASTYYGMSDEEALVFDHIAAVASGRGNPASAPDFVMVSEFTQAETATITLVLQHVDGEQRIPLPLPADFADSASLLVNKLDLEIENMEMIRGRYDGAHSSGIRENRFAGESDIDDLVNQAFELITAVQYAKDPRTGAGFFSTTWNGELTVNKTVGPWGWEDSNARTPISSTAAITSVVSV